MVKKRSKDTAPAQQYDGSGIIPPGGPITPEAIRRKREQIAQKLASGAIEMTQITELNEGETHD